MAPGPAKQFDPDEALLRARDLFWRLGYDGTGIRDLETELGIGRKSLYDTFGSKRELYLASLRLYVDTVIAHIRGRLEHEGATPMANLEQALRRLQSHHGSKHSLGCLLGVAMGQSTGAEEDVAAIVRDALRGLERSFERTIRLAQDAGEVRADLVPKDVARSLVAVTQGMALIGRMQDAGPNTRSIVRATLSTLRS